MRTIVLAALLLVALDVRAQPMPPKPEAPIGFSSESMVWTDAPPPMVAGSKLSVLEGNPRGDGMFTIRIRIPAGSVMPPHWHPRPERVTVLAGAVDLGFGPIAGQGPVTRYRTGSFYINPSRVMHYLSFPEATELQVTGVGPWEVLTSDISRPVDRMSTATVTLRRITPAALSELTSSMTIRAVVDYDIRDFRPSTYWLDFVFESTTPGRSFGAPVDHRSDGPLMPPRPPYLESATGTITITQDLSRIFSNPELKRPIRVRILVHQRTTDFSSRVPGNSDWIEFR
ncbi:MAG: cupin domain-containing protein [Thermoanaerobaculia bacterium]